MRLNVSKITRSEEPQTEVASQNNNANAYQNTFPQLVIIAESSVK